MPRSVIVIGGGISGLGVAYALHREGVGVRLIEARSDVGGVIRSHRVEGYLIEHGPTSALNHSVEIERVIDDLGLTGERVFASPAARRRYIVRGGRPLPLPTGPIAFLTTPLWSARAKWRLLGEPFAPRAPAGEESIAAFVTRRMGSEFCDYAVDPFVSGVYAGDPHELSLASTFPRLHAMECEHGGLIRGAIAQIGRPRAARPTRRGIYSFREGLAELPRALGAELGDALWVNTRVRTIDRGSAGFRVTVARADGGEFIEEAERLVLAVPADAAAELARPWAPVLADELGAIVYAPVAIVYLAFPRSGVLHALDGFGCLVPRRERRTILGSLWTSTVFPGRVPDGMVGLTNFVGGATQPELIDRPDHALIASVLEDLDRLLGIRSPPAFAHVIRHARAIPQYLIGHGERLARIEREVARIKGLSLAGNYLRGVSVNDCFEKGLALGRALAS
ncbi:MAG: protoporphyrinogen oxidase [Nitrospiria bacterium]